jgi:hypothetical protein
MDFPLVLRFSSIWIWWTHNLDRWLKAILESFELTDAGGIVLGAILGFLGSLLVSWVTDRRARKREAFNLFAANAKQQEEEAEEFLASLNSL